MPYDYVGCFSGSALELPDGQQLFMYTSVRKEAQPDGSVRDIQTQSLAVGDGMDYEKDVTGNLNPLCFLMMAASEKCGSARISLHWMERMWC